MSPIRIKHFIAKFCREQGSRVRFHCNKSFFHQTEKNEFSCVVWIAQAYAEQLVRAGENATTTQQPEGLLMAFWLSMFISS